MHDNQCGRLKHPEKNEKFIRRSDKYSIPILIRLPVKISFQYGSDQRAVDCLSLVQKLSPAGVGQQ